MRNKATKKNMDLDLRRYGRNEFTKAMNSGGGNSGSSGNSGSDGELNMKEVIKNAFIEMGAANVAPDIVYPDTFFIPPSIVCKTAEDLVKGIAMGQPVIPIYKDIPGNVTLETPVSSEDLGDTYLFWRINSIAITKSGFEYIVEGEEIEGEEYYSLQVYDNGGGGGGIA